MLNLFVDSAYRTWVRYFPLLMVNSYCNRLVELGRTFIVDKLLHLVIETTLFTHSKGMKNRCDCLKFYFIVVRSMSKGILYPSSGHYQSLGMCLQINQG